MTTSTPAEAPAAPPTAPFGRMLTAMITPMTAEGAVDYDGAARLASYLVDDMRNDGLVVSGTTGEAPVTSDEEKERLLRTVVEAVGDRASIVAGVGTNDTAHTRELARQAEQRAGADGLLVVTPYYSKPPQHALLAHFRAVADAADLPVLLYDIPGRTGTPIKTETLVQREHPRIVGVKDAKDDVAATSEVLARTDLVYYCGTDMLNLPWLSLGAVGFVSVVGHVAGDLLHEMIDEFEAGQTGRARELHLSLLPVYTGMFRNQGLVMTKAALAMLGLPGGPVRPPLASATPAEIRRLREDLERGGLKLPGATA